MTTNILWLRARGDIEEQVVNLDEQPLATLLGGDITLVGKLPLLEAVIVKLRAPGKTAHRNKHVLPFPYHVDEETGEPHQGDLILVSVPEDEDDDEDNEEDSDDKKTKWTLTASSFKDFLKIAPSNQQELEEFIDKHGLREEEEDDEVVPDDDLDAITGQEVFAAFRKQHNRDPTEDEFVAMMMQAGVEIGEDDDDEDDDGEEMDEEEEHMFSTIVEAFQEEHGRMPTVEEIQRIWENMNNEAVGEGEDEDDDDDDDGEEHDVGRAAAPSHSNKRAKRG